MDSDWARLAAWLALKELHGVGLVSAWRLVAAVGGDILALTTKSNVELQALGLTGELQSSFAQEQQRALVTIAKWQEQHPDGWLLTPDAAAYPPQLLEIAAAPLLLYGLGDAALLSAPQIAIVGTRHPTYTGRENSQRLAQELSEHNLVVTSGLALGIDAIAHQSALDSGGQTIAVLGSGCENIYPKRNQSLATAILAAGGVLLSEYAPKAPPLAEHFPQRNRIISGLALGVVVVEAAERSGSLITARYALEQGRELFAIPGAPQNLQALGCNRLIQQGAKLLINVDDLLVELPNLPTITKENGSLTAKTAMLPLTFNNPDLAAVESSLDFCLTTVDDVAARTSLPVATVLAALVELELLGTITAVDGGYCRKSR